MKKKLSAYWWCQVIGWGAFLLLTSFFYFFIPRLTDFPNYLFIISTTLIGILTSHLMRLFIIKRKLLELAIAKQFLAVFLTSILFSLIFSVLAWIPDFLFPPADYNYNFSFFEAAFTGTWLNAQFFGIWNLIYFLYHYVQKSKKHLIESVRLESELKIQQLENENTKLQLQKNIADISLTALRSQMNPHFIFNCLNSIKLYTLQNDIISATDYLNKFSRLIRLVMEESAKEKIVLASELNILQLYIEMEAMRFKEKLQYKINVAEDVETTYIELPPMLLQPYIENAIWHGLMPKEEGGKLGIDVMIDNEKSLLTIIVADDGIGRKKSAEFKSKTVTKHESFGMRVTSERIALINHVYRTGAEVKIDDLTNTDGNACGTKVTIQIPV